MILASAAPSLSSQSFRKRPATAAYEFAVLQAVSFGPSCRMDRLTDFSADAPACHPGWLTKVTPPSTFAAAHKSATGAAIVRGTVNFVNLPAALGQCEHL